MESLSETAARILEIETRQDEALRQLDELEQRLEQVLAQHLPSSATAAAIPINNAAAPAAASAPARGKRSVSVKAA